MDLNQITIPSKDLSIAVKFYTMLGLRLIVDAQPDYVRFECPKGNSTLSIRRVKELPSHCSVHIYFEVADLDETVQKLQQKGITFSQLPTDKKWLWKEAQLSDPDYNHLVLFYAGENRKNPPWRVKDDA